MAQNQDGEQSPLGRLKRFFTRPQQGQAKPEVDRLQLATCVVLLEVAWADQEFSPDEKQHLIGALRERFSLTDKEAGDLIELAAAHRSESADLWHYTHEINQSCSREEKFEILADVWRIIYMDNALNRHEDYLVHKLAKLLNIDHPEMIDVKMQVRREMTE